MKTITLDFTDISDRRDLYAYLKERFGLPDFYGSNLDALYDALTAVMEDTRIEFAEDDADTCCEAVWGIGPVNEELDRYLKQVRRVIEDAAEENGHLYI
ncbi:MAG: barnase inhibitor [Lachnospiraceae bacterium]|nr:barnase inhibitor [Lachnospiraceae bacterium]